MLRPIQGVSQNHNSRIRKVWYDETMIVVIIAGGSGSRLWPLSTPTYPKQLLQVNGDQRSLLQNAFARAQQLTDTNNIYIVPEQSMAEHVRTQLPELPEDHLIIEPARRGTASCIVLAMAEIGKRHGHDEPIIFVHSDHYIRDTAGFVHSVRVASDAATKHGRMVLVGIEPDHPATGFGYIQKDEVLDEQSFVFTVHSFKEKPDHQTAQQYLRSGNYLWNCGYFVGTIKIFEETMQAYASELFASYGRLAAAGSDDERTQTYLGLENIAIDYALIEKVPNLLVVPASFDWMDLGSFSDLYNAADLDDEGNYLAGLVATEEVQNAFVQNLEDKPVAVIGLDNVVVINTPDGILVARKDLSQRVGDVSKRLLQEI